jgi:hypothetical protein
MGIFMHREVEGDEKATRNCALSWSVGRDAYR